MPLYRAVLLTVALSLSVTAALSTGCWLLWTVEGLGTTYFGFLPPIWQVVSLRHMIGLFALFGVVRAAITGINIQTTGSLDRDL